MEDSRGRQIHYVELAGANEYGDWQSGRDLRTCCLFLTRHLLRDGDDVEEELQQYHESDNGKHF